MHYLNFGIILFVIALLVAIVVSLLTDKEDEKYTRRLTFWSRHEAEHTVEREPATLIRTHRIVPGDGQMVNMTIIEKEKEQKPRGKLKFFIALTFQILQFLSGAVR